MQKIRFLKITIRKEAGLTPNLQYHKPMFFPSKETIWLSLTPVSALITFHKNFARKQTLNVFYFLKKKMKS